MVSKTPPLEGL